MASPFLPDQVIKAENFISESERDATPANDAGKLVQLESTGRISPEFIGTVPLSVTEFTADGTWTKPAEGTFALIEIWGAGASASARSTTDSFTAIAATGAGGGEYRKVISKLGDLDATYSVTVGVGGASVATPNNNSSVTGNDGGNSSFEDFIANGGKASGTGGAEQSYGEGGSNGGSSSTNALNTIMSGAGGGGASSSQFDNLNTGNGGKALFRNTNGSNGVGNLSGNATSADADTACGSGGAVARNGIATSGKGGDGFVRITIF